MIHFLHIVIQKSFQLLFNLIYIYYLPKLFSEVDLSDFYYYQSIFSQLFLFDFGLGLALNIYLQNESTVPLDHVSSFRALQFVFLLISLLSVTIVLFFITVKFQSFFILLVFINAFSIIFRIDNIKGDVSRSYRNYNVSSILTLIIFCLLYHVRSSNLYFYFTALYLPQFVVFLVHNIIVQKNAPFQNVIWLKIKWRVVFKYASGLMLVSLASLVLNISDASFLKNTEEFIEYSQIIRLCGIILIPVSIISIIQQNNILNPSGRIKMRRSPSLWYYSMFASLVYGLILIYLFQIEMFRYYFNLTGFIRNQSSDWYFNFSMYIIFMILLIFFSVRDTASKGITRMSLFYFFSVIGSLCTKLVISPQLTFKTIILLNFFWFSIIYFIPSTIYNSRKYEEN